MSWFRWHHGSVNDPKFKLIALKAGASVAEVLAVWAVLLEAASAADDRGNVGDQDFEAIDCALGMSEGKAAGIVRQMIARGLVREDRRITSWERRQPKREREDGKSAERKRRQRERDAAGGEIAPAWQATDRNVTPCHAVSRHEPPREEESRAEVNTSDAYASGGEPPAGALVGNDPAAKPAPLTNDEIIFVYGVPLLTAAGTPEKQARSFLGGLRKAHGDVALIDKLRECLKTKPLQPLEWLGAALPPKGKGPRMPAPDNFDAKDYGHGGKL